MIESSLAQEVDDLPRDGLVLHDEGVAGRHDDEVGCALDLGCFDAHGTVVGTRDQGRADRVHTLAARDDAERAQVVPGTV